MATYNEQQLAIAQSNLTRALETLRSARARLRYITPWVNDFGRSCPPSPPGLVLTDQGCASGVDLQRVQSAEALVARRQAEVRDWSARVAAERSGSFTQAWSTRVVAERTAPVPGVAPIAVALPPPTPPPAPAPAPVAAAALLSADPQTRIAAAQALAYTDAAAQAAAAGLIGAPPPVPVPLAPYVGEGPGGGAPPVVVPLVDEASPVASDYTRYAAAAAGVLVGATLAWVIAR